MGVVRKMMFLRLMIPSQHTKPRRRLASGSMSRFQIQRRWRWLKTINGVVRILRKWMMVSAMSSHLMNKRLALIT